MYGEWLSACHLNNTVTVYTHCTQNEVVAKLGPKVTEAVSHCPRLGYLSQRQILKVLSCRGDPLPIIPLITRMFPSIKTLRFVETSSNTDRDSSKGV